MSFTLLFVIMFVSFCLLLLFCLPWVLRSSPEATRMFALVKSTREDKRRIGFSEHLTNLLAGKTRQVRTRLGKSTNDKMLKRFAQAGLVGSYVADLFFIVQGLGFIGGALCGSFSSSNPVFWMLANGVAAFMVPDLWLAARQKRRLNRVRLSVPDMVDLLVICVGAGLGLDQALLRVSEELSLSHPDIAAELARVTLERRAGASRNDAWAALAERTRIEELSAFVSMLTETDRFGSPIAKALNDFSEELRTKRRQRAEEAAAKTKIKIIFPLVICIFPCIFIVLLAPALLQFVHSFSTIAH